MQRRKIMLERTIQKEVAQIIQSDIKDPRLLSLVSILHADLSSNMESLKLRVSIFGGALADNQKTWLALQSSLGHISSLLSHRLRMRVAPHIILIREDTLLALDAEPEEVPTPPTPNKRVNKHPGWSHWKPLP